MQKEIAGDSTVRETIIDIIGFKDGLTKNRVGEKMIGSGKKEIQDVYALIPMQEGMLFYYLKNPESDLYFEQLCLRICGVVETGVFQKAWDFVVKNGLNTSDCDLGSMPRPLSEMETCTYSSDNRRVWTVIIP